MEERRSEGVGDGGREGWRTEGAAASRVWFTRLARCLLACSVEFFSSSLLLSVLQAELVVQ